MLPHILIADPDEAFGLMLKQVLELNGNYSAEHVPSGALALAAVRTRQPDLVIVDMALTDVPPPALISSIRQVAPETRSMLIPLNGTISEDVKAIGIQGTLSKPFFIGDLGEQIANALGTEVKPLVIVAATPEKSEHIMSASPENSGREVDASAAKKELEISPPTPSVRTPPPPPPSSRRAPPPPPASRRAAPTRRVAASPGESTLDGALMALAVEIRAEAVFLFRNGAVLAQRSDFSGARLERLVERLVSWRQAAADLAALLGERGGFQRKQLEGEHVLLVTYDIDPATFLLALCRSDVPLGTLRLHVRSAADRIIRILPQQTSFATSPNTK